MSKYSTLKAEIIASIKRNGAQAITGDLLQEKLLSMIDSLGEFYQFGGLAIPSTEFTPGDEPVVFIAATPGTYTNFGGLVVADNEVALLVWDGSAWSKQTTDIATRSEVSQLGQKIYTHSEYGEIGAYVTNDGTWSTNYNPKSKYVKVYRGDHIVASKSSGNFRLCFLKSIDITQNPVFVYGSVIENNNYDAIVVEDSYLVWIIGLEGGTSAEPDLLTINGFSFLQTTNGETLFELQQKEITECKDEIFLRSQYGKVDAYVSGNQWLTQNNPVSRYINICSGDRIQATKGIVNFYICFVKSVDTTQPVQYAFGGIYQGETLDVVADDDCYLVWLSVLVGNNANPSVLTINGESCLNGKNNETNFDVVKKDINDLNKVVYAHSEYGEIDAYVVIGGNWQTQYNPISKYVNVFKGDRVQATKGSANLYLCCVTSVNISQPTTIIGEIITGESCDFIVSQDSYLLWIKELDGNDTSPSVLNINGVSYLNGYKKETSFDKRIFDQNVEIINNSRRLDNIATDNSTVIVLTDENTTLGKWWNVDANGDATMVDGNAVALNELISVQPGSIYRIYGAIARAGVAILGGYDENGHGYDYGVARINVPEDGIHDGYIELTIPLRCRKIGIFATISGSLRTRPIVAVTNNDFDFTEKTISKIESIIARSNSGSEAYYYQKGAAPKKFERIPCILVAGQSNGAGRVPMADLPSYMRAASPYTKCQMEVYGWPGGFRTVNVDSYFSDKWGYDLVVYYHVSAVNNLDLYVMKHAIGGTSIDPDGPGVGHWSADYEKVIAEGSEPLVLQFNEMIVDTIKANPNLFDVRALLWHQGEGDYDASVSGKYYQNFKDMVAYIRGVVGNVELPVIYGTISHLSAGYSQEVEQAQLLFAQTDPYADVIDMSGAPLLDESPEPPLHFNAASCIYLGEMVFNCLVDRGVIEADKLTPVRPW